MNGLGSLRSSASLTRLQRSELNADENTSSRENRLFGSDKRANSGEDSIAPSSTRGATGAHRRSEMERDTNGDLVDSKKSSDGAASGRTLRAPPSQQFDLL